MDYVYHELSPPFHEERWGTPSIQKVKVLANQELQQIRPPLPVLRTSPLRRVQVHISAREQAGFPDRFISDL